jgi:hypothetical protein
MTVMTLQRLSDLLAAYGGRVECWPEAERDAARALLERSAAAQAEYEAARRLDAALDAAPAFAPSADLETRILAAAPSVRAGRPAAPVADGSRTRRGISRGTRRGVGRWVAATALAAAAVTLWLRVPEPEPHRPAAAALTIAELGSYEMPSDVLLGSLDDDLATTVPTLGCDESGLGCLDAEPLDEVGARPTRRMLV